MALLPVIPGQLPAGFCGTSYQDILNEFSSHQSVDVGAGSGASLVVSATKPTDESSAWLRLDQFGRPDRVYWFASGAWLSLHPIVPGLTQWWFDVLPNFTTFDGGDALALSAISGPMWQRAKNSDGVMIEAKFPVAAGTLPSTTVLAQGATGGEEKHSLTTPELAPHTHPVDLGTQHAFALNIGDSPEPLKITSGSGTQPLKTSVLFNTNEAGGTDGVVVPHNTMPVFVVGYLLQRTSRLYFAIS